VARNSVFTNRCVTLQKKLIQKNIDALFVSNLSNVFYLTGFRGTNAYLLVTKKSILFYTDFRYKEEAEAVVKHAKIVIYSDSFLSLLFVVFQKKKIVRCGFESSSLTYDQFVRFRRGLKGVKLVPQDSIVEELRIIKDAQELKTIKKCARVIERVIHNIRPKIHEGVTEKEVAAEIEYVMRLYGAQKSSFDPIVAFGASTSCPHAQITNRALKKGDAIMIDAGCIIDGYSSDLTRTFFFNNINARLKKIYHVVYEAQKKALDAIRIGVKASYIDRIAREYITKSGYGPYFGHALGHGVGINVHELPRISSASDVLLETGMVCTIEPGIYVPRVGGVRIEDMVCVTESGCELITGLSKNLDDCML